jgi:uncharacterized protein YjbI with pentapeptide repeats
MDGATFAGATFSFEAEFGDWGGKANFLGATFAGDAYFAGATFSSPAYFNKATFAGTTSFINAEMNGATSFEGATFEKRPLWFFGAKLHQSTVWCGIMAPPQEQG